MSKINELIKKLCSNGVEYQKLSDIGELLSGLKSKEKNDFGNGNAKFITYSNIFNNLTVDFNIFNKVKVSEKENQNDIRLGDILITASSEIADESGMTSVVTKNPSEIFYVNSFCLIYRLNNDYREKILPNFAKHLFRSTEIRNQIIMCANGVTRFNLKKKDLLKIKIPIPPLEVQNEIINILDGFVNLEAELEAELEARKTQYGFYRKKIMNLKSNYVTMKLGEIYEFKYGTGNVIPTIGGIYPVYGSNGIVGTHNQYNSENSPVIGHIGAYAGIVNWGIGKHYVTYNGVICRHKNNLVVPRYAYYLLLIQNFGEKAKSSSQPFISYQTLNETIVNIPKSLQEQVRIVNILDKFDKLISDISEGLPAEIEVRRKQYEYYRDKLLSFEELKYE